MSGVRVSSDAVSYTHLVPVEIYSDGIWYYTGDSQDKRAAVRFSSRKEGEDEAVEDVYKRQGIQGPAAPLRRPTAGLTAKRRMRILLP